MFAPLNITFTFSTTRWSSGHPHLGPEVTLDHVALLVEVTHLGHGVPGPHLTLVPALLVVVHTGPRTVVVCVLTGHGDVPRVHDVHHAEPRGLRAFVVMIVLEGPRAGARGLEGPRGGARDDDYEEES